MLHYKCNKLLIRTNFLATKKIYGHYRECVHLKQNKTMSRINPVNINVNNEIFRPKNSVKNFIRGIEVRSLAPVIFLECFVTGGRTINAEKRGGFIEARERLTEELIGAIFWFGGVKALNKFNDFALSKALGIKDTSFDVKSDSIRNPLGNYIKKTAESGNPISKSKIAGFKFTKVAASVIVANALVGFVVPKLNQGITRLYQSKEKKFNPQVNFDQFRTMGHNPNFGMTDFMEKAEENKNKIGNKKDTSFTGGADLFLNLAHKLENDSYWQLLSTDVGITTGRTISARNIHERIEIFFRDVVSLFFYMFSMPLINKLLNKLEQGKAERLNPVGATQATDYMQHIFKETGHTADGKLSVSPEEFEKIMFGDKDIKVKFDKIKPSIKDGAITLDEFKTLINNNFAGEDAKLYKELAEKMSKLQPLREGIAVLSESQVKAIFEGGALNNPEFWDKVFEANFGTSKVKQNVNGVTQKVEIANHKNPMKYVSQKSLDETIEKVKHYVQSLADEAKAKAKNIDVNSIEKACKKNMKMNVINWTTGFAISAFFLSTVIPKIQYWITRKTTGSDEFPGIKNYENDKIITNRKAA